MVETDAVALPLEEKAAVLVSSCGPVPWLAADVVKVASVDEEVPFALPLTTW